MDSNIYEEDNAGVANISLLQQGIDLIAKAIEMDKIEQYKEAIRLYDLALWCFLECITNEMIGEKASEHLQSRCKIYIKRRDQLNDYLT